MHICILLNHRDRKRFFGGQSRFEVFKDKFQVALELEATKNETYKASSVQFIETNDQSGNDKVMGLAGITQQQSRLKLFLCEYLLQSPDQNVVFCCISHDWTRETLIEWYEFLRELTILPSQKKGKSQVNCIFLEVHLPPRQEISEELVPCFCSSPPVLCPITPCITNSSIRICPLHPQAWLDRIIQIILKESNTLLVLPSETRMKSPISQTLSCPLRTTASPHVLLATMATQRQKEKHNLSIAIPPTDDFMSSQNMNDDHLSTLLTEEYEFSQWDANTNAERPNNWDLCDAQTDAQTSTSTMAITDHQHEHWQQQGGVGRENQEERAQNRRASWLKRYFCACNCLFPFLATYEQ